MDGFVYTIRSVPVKTDVPAGEAPPGDAIKVDADRSGHVLFREEPVQVSADRIQEGLDNCLAVAKTLVAKATGAISNYQVDKITLKLALDAGVGVVFVGDAKIKAAIEVEITRVSRT